MHSNFYFYMVQTNVQAQATQAPTTWGGIVASCNAAAYLPRYAEPTYAPIKHFRAGDAVCAVMPAPLMPSSRPQPFTSILCACSPHNNSPDLRNSGERGAGTHGAHSPPPHLWQYMCQWGQSQQGPDEAKGFLDQAWQQEPGSTSTNHA